MRVQTHPAGSALLTPTRRGRRVIWLAGGAGVLLTALGFILRGAPIDAPAVEALNRAHTGAWGQTADAIYFTLEPVPAAFLTLLILITIAVVLRSVRTAIVFGGIVALTWLPTAAIKVVVDRPRPDVATVVHPFTPAQVDGSFPSGHTAFIAALTIAFWFLLRGTRGASIALIIGTLSTVIVGLAVVSDGLHYPTDVLASIMWAIAMAPTARWIMVDVIAPRLERYRKRS